MPFGWIFLCFFVLSMFPGHVSDFKIGGGKGFIQKKLDGLNGLVVRRGGHVRIQLCLANLLIYTLIMTRYRVFTKIRLVLK